MERKLKHLDFIQGVVNRLSTNSFLLKGWSVVLVSALIALGSQNGSPNYVYLALLPGFVLWGLDGYFLWQERLYRRLYERVREKEPDSIDFCMNTKPVKNDVKGWISAIVSPTLLVFHGVLIVSILVVMYFESQS